MITITVAVDDNYNGNNKLSRNYSKAFSVQYSKF